MRVWGGFFFKKFREGNHDYKRFHRYKELYVQHFMNKKQADELRRELLVKHKLVQERRALLKDLKELEG